MIDNILEKTVVLHCIGAGRSGSTLLNIMLDNHPHILGTGELIFFAQSILSDNYCSCGQFLKNCPFWARVKNEWLLRTKMENLEEYINLQKKYERYRSIPAILKETKSLSEEFRRYCQYSYQLFEIVKEISGAEVIFDSSKKPARVLSLNAIPNIDLRVVFLVRDARGYAWSKLKSFHENKKAGLGWRVAPMPVWKSTCQWVVINSISAWVLKKVDKYMVVRYEDLTNNPDQVLSDIGGVIRIDLSSITKSINDGNELIIDHISAGNRLRMKNKIRLENRKTWETEMSRSKKAISWLISRWLMKQLGY